MQTNATSPHEDSAASTPAQLHATQHVDSHSISDSVKFGMLITIACFLPLGVLIGIDRAPGSFYVYGFSCFIWPMVSVIALGVAIGGSLGYVFGAIGHASDPVQAAEAAPEKAAKQNRVHLSLHSHRH